MTFYYSHAIARFCPSHSCFLLPNQSPSTFVCVTQWVVGVSHSWGYSQEHGYLQWLILMKRTSPWRGVLNQFFIHFSTRSHRKTRPWISYVAKDGLELESRLPPFWVLGLQACTPCQFRHLYDAKGQTQGRVRPRSELYQLSYIPTLLFVVWRLYLLNPSWP